MTTTYCALYDVKKRLQIEVNDVSSDPELQDVILEAMTVMDEDLKAHVTTPLTVVPGILKYACADLTASIFKSRRSKPEAHGEDLAVGFRQKYDEKLTKYLANLSSASSSSPLYIGTDTG